MRANLLLALLLAGCASAAVPPAAAGPAPAAGRGDRVDAAVKEAVGAELPSLVELYQWFHANAELSRQEEKTAARFAAEVGRAGWSVTEHLGGHGVLAVLRNGSGPVVFARVDMDGLPVKEDTGLAYASPGPAMHACGHDSHLAMGVGVARVLARLKDRWSGTLVLAGQPAEEIGLGSKLMLADPRFEAALPGKPVACLSVHDFPAPGGTVSLCPGYSWANVDSLDITVFGRGGHGAWPHLTVDPIIIASEIVTSLQTIVSRKLAPGTRAVVTVGSFHAGTKHNVIPDQAKLQLTVRSYDPAVRTKLLEEIRHIAEAVSEEHHATRKPEIAYGEEPTPAGYNDPELSERLRGVFERLLGKDRVAIGEPVMGGEDFSRFPLHFGVPGVQFRVGGARPGHDPSIGLHSSRWSVDPEPTLRTGTQAFARACLELLGTR